MNASNKIKKLKELICADYKQCIYYINEHIENSSYEVFLAQKLLQNLYANSNFTLDQKKEILLCLGRKFLGHEQEIINNYRFIETFFPIANNLYFEIETLVKSNFQQSLFVFSYCMGLYVQKNLNTIHTAKNFILTVARKVLTNDMSLGKLQSQIVLANSVYYDNETAIETIYEKAIKYGVIREKYDAISFNREKIVHISIQDSVPFLTLKLSNSFFETGLQQGVIYTAYLSGIKAQEEPGFVHSYYKCKICKYCLISNVPDDEKEYAFELLKRQYSHMNITDTFYFLTGDMPSYIFSMISLLYTELIKLVVFSDLTYMVLSKNDIKQQMLWGNYISQSDFETCFYLVINHESFRGYFLPINNGKDILIGSWMFDFDLSIIERTKEVAFDSSKASQLGKGSNYFGKNVLEKVVRDKICDFGWQSVKTAVKLKQNKKIATDVDLIAYKNGVVLVGQLKVANCGRDSYQIWKAKQIISQAVSQAKLSVDILKNDIKLIYSILKRAGIGLHKEEIKYIVPIVVTSSNYFIGLTGESGVAVISFDMLCETMYYAQDDVNNELTLRLLENPALLYSFSAPLETIISEIIQDEFHIIYEECEI